MRNLLIGIDSGTQSTKVVVVDSRDGKVLASAAQSYDLIPDLPPGAKEQHPHTWRLRRARYAGAVPSRRAGGRESGHRTAPRWPALFHRANQPRPPWSIAFHYRSQLTDFA